MIYDYDIRLGAKTLTITLKVCLLNLFFFLSTLLLREEILVDQPIRCNLAKFILGDKIYFCGRSMSLFGLR